MHSLDELAGRVGSLLLEQSRLLVTAESCTGGWVAKCITDIAGSSAWFDRGFVTYSNRAKQDMLDVAAATLEVHGAVSAATVSEMVRGALVHSAGGRRCRRERHRGSRRRRAGQAGRHGMVCLARPGRCAAGGQAAV